MHERPYKRKERLGSLLQKCASVFLKEAVPPGALATVTSLTLSKDISRGTVFFTIYPESKEKEVVKTLSKQPRAFYEYLKMHTNIKHIPFFAFAIDKGEKNRARVTELLAADEQK